MGSTDVQAWIFFGIQIFFFAKVVVTTVQWSLLSSFINPQFKYLYYTLRDGALFFWRGGGGVRNIEKKLSAEANYLQTWLGK